MRSGGGERYSKSVIPGRALARAPESITTIGSMDSRPAPRGASRNDDLILVIQSPHNLVELFEVAVADVHGAAGIAVIDVDHKAERIADAFFQRDRIGIFHLAAARFLGFALRHTLDMCQRLGLAHIEAFVDDTFGGSSRIGHADQGPRVAGRWLARR